MNISGDNQRKLQQLSDMFSDVTPMQIRSVCEQNSWNVDVCIDQLINKSNEDHDNEKPQGARSVSAGDAAGDLRLMPGVASVGNDYNSPQQGAIPKSINNDLSQYAASQNYFDRQVQKPTLIKQFQNNIRKSSSLTKMPDTTEQKLIEQISAGFKILIIMRGAPGSGKSYLATSLVEKSNVLSNGLSFRDFVLSSDDYFYDNSGRYKYNVTKLEEAHNFNHRRVNEKAAAGWSPIIVDNTNMKIWEMMPYVQAAVRYGYILHLLEPNTPWRLSAGKLAMKNQHRVQREKIQIMLDRYEKATASDLIKMMKSTKYNVPLPQMRNFPPLSIKTGDMDTKETFKDFSKTEKRHGWPSSIERDQMQYADPLMQSPTTLTDPKPQRKTMRSKSSSKIALKLDENEDESVQSLDEEATLWKPFELEANHFWGASPEVEHKIIDSSLEKPDGEIIKHDKSLLDLLKEGVTDIPEKQKNTEVPEQQNITFQKHRIECPNENKQFASLRQIYPNKQLNGLWDLFVKCNGDIDWAIDILLKEDELSFCDDAYEALENDENTLSCMCHMPASGQKQPPALSESIKVLQETSATINCKPQRSQRGRPQRNNQNRSSALLEMKETIENRFVLGEEHYSTHVQKIRNMRNGEIENSSVPKKPYSSDMACQTDPVIDAEDEQDNDGTELLEINLGEQFVKQLSNVFMSEILNCDLPENLNSNVFMPKSLAKELFMLWIESAYNQIEEQRQNTLREDEDFARLLKNPKYENCKEPPENIREILDMELAWMIYKNEHEQLKQQKVDLAPNDIAEHLSQMKLCELFPNIPRETIMNVFAAHGNKFDETIAVLQSNIERTDINKTQNVLLERALQENELLNKEIEVEQQQYKGYPASTHSMSNYDRPIKPPLQPDEAKRMALRDFEETRNFAAHHSQLKAECYQKARDAIQRGNNGVAVYYSQIANLHKKKIDMYNHRAANCIMEVHKYTQNNPDLLDLHYLHVLEAVGCLDIFLDRHLTNLRCQAKCYKHVFIITGRGLHSSGGVSIIKNKVKSRLKERSLRWSEVNPGLLKVKLFSASRYSKNI